MQAVETALGPFFPWLRVAAFIIVIMVLAKAVMDAKSGALSKAAVKVLGAVLLGSFMWSPSTIGAALDFGSQQVDATLRSGAQVSQEVSGDTGGQ